MNFQPITRAIALQRTANDNPVWARLPDGTTDKIYGIGKLKCIGKRATHNLTDIEQFLEPK